jgi:biotin operon repressor
MPLADTVRERARQLLTTTTGPLPTPVVAERLGTTRDQAGRALRQLEREGAAVRDRGRPWVGPDQWSAAR